MMRTGTFITLTCVLFAGCSKEGPPGLSKEGAEAAIAKVKETKSGRLLMLQILENTSATHAMLPYHSDGSGAERRISLACTHLTRRLLDAAIAYRAETNKLSKAEADALAERVHSKFAGTRPFVIWYTQERRGYCHLAELDKRLLLVTEHGNRLAPEDSRYTRGLEAVNVWSAGGYVYFPAVDLDTQSSFNIELSGIKAGDRRNSKEHYYPPVVFQFDTSEVDLAELIRQGLTDDEILSTPGVSIAMSLSPGDVASILGFVLQIFSML